MVPDALNRQALCAAVLIAVAWTCVRGQNGPCNASTPLHSLSLRVAGYNLTDGEQPVSDYYIDEGWYSMGSYVIATSSVNCGTHYPWHIEGELPKDTQRTELTSCNARCDVKKDVSVIKCDNGNYIFNLQPLDSISEAYCIENTDEGNKDLTAPVIQFTPTISTEVKLLDGKNNLHFYCIFTPPIHRTLLFTVEWILTSGFTDVKLLHRVEHISIDEIPNKTALNEDRLRERGVIRFPFTIKCSVTAQTDIAGKHSNAMTSEDKFCGIKVSPKDVMYLKNEDKATIQLTLTVPFGCFNGDTDCTLNADVFVPKQPTVCELSQIGQIDEVRTQCGVTFDSKKFNETMTFTITGIAGGRNVADSTKRTLLFKTIDYNNHQLFSKYSFEGPVVWLDMDTSKIDGKTCYSHNDPHILTFEGVQYDNQVEGTYILYKHNKYEIEVQVSSKKVSESVSLNCGIAIRVGRDVFVFSICHAGAPEIGFRTCEDGVLHNKVTRLANVYTVFLPTGTRVNIKADGSRVVNFEVIPAVEDIESTTGLCGTIDTNRETPNPSDYRVNDSTNLFKPENNKDLPHWSDKIYVCSCRKGAKRLGVYGVQESICDASFKKKCNDDRSTVSKLSQVCAKARRKRNVQHAPNSNQTRHTSYWANDDLHLSRQTSYIRPVTSRYIQEHYVFKRKIYDEDSARSDCMAILNTTAFQKCSNLPNLDVTPMMNNCITDAMLTNSMEYSLTHLESIKDQCIYHVRVNQPLSAKAQAELKEATELENDTRAGDAQNDTAMASVTTSTPARQDSIFSEDFLREIEDISCPNECSGHGQCLKGKCECDTGYIDIDCSMGVNDPPIMNGIPDLGLCDRQLRSCQQTSVFGEQIVETANPLCRLVPFIVDPQSQMNFTEMSVVPAEVISLFEVRCPLPVAREKRDTSSYTTDNNIASGYKISISNNGQTFSDEDFLVVFDSRCVDCTKNGTDIVCKQKSGFCTRGGECYMFGEKYGCELCGGDDISRLHWIPDMECGPMPDDSKPKLWVIAAVLVPVALVIILVVLFFFCKTGPKGRGSKIDLQLPMQDKSKS